MSFKVLIADQLNPEGLAIFQEAAESLDLEIVDRSPLSAAELLRLIPDFEALIVRSGSVVTAPIIQAGKNLKVIGRAGIGVDNVDVAAATQAGIVVMNTPEGNATTTAEHTIAMILALARQIPQAAASMRALKWEKKKFLGRELCNKTLGIIGLGNIGRIVANRALGLKLKVIGFDPFLDKEAASRLGIELCSIEEVLKQADILTIHTPLNEQTRDLISDAQIAVMKPGVLLINCARGGIYNEAALLRGLEAGKIGGVALDVFVHEPPLPEQDAALLTHEKVICTPHLGAATTEAQVQVSIDIAKQIVEFVRGEPARNAVNLPRISTREFALLEPYIDLGKRLGSFSAQIHKGTLEEIAITITGDVAELATEFISTAIIVGALQVLLDSPINFVNARLAAKARGIKISETKLHLEESGYAGTLRVKVSGDQETHTVAGTLLTGGQGRFIEVDQTPLEVVPAGYLLLIHNDDQPGVIGHIGTLIGAANINISRMHLGLQNGSDKALAVVNIDQALSAELLERLTTHHVLWVRQVYLPPDPFI